MSDDLLSRLEEIHTWLASANVVSRDDFFAAIPHMLRVSDVSEIEYTL